MQALSSNIADILEAHPRRQIDFDLSRVDIGQLTLMELLDASEACGLPWDEFKLALEDREKQVKLFYSLAWVIMRRAEPDLTYEQVQEFDLIVKGSFNEEMQEKAQKRAKAVVAVAQVARVTPREAEKLTIHQVEAATNLQQARNRRLRRKR